MTDLTHRVVNRRIRWISVDSVIPAVTHLAIVAPSFAQDDRFRIGPVYLFEPKGDVRAALGSGRKARCFDDATMPQNCSGAESWTDGRAVVTATYEGSRVYSISLRMLQTTSSGNLPKRLGTIASWKWLGAPISEPGLNRRISGLSRSIDGDLQRGRAYVGYGQVGGPSIGFALLNGRVREVDLDGPE
jgi:hypothetical protein